MKDFFHFSDAKETALEMVQKLKDQEKAEKKKKVENINKGRLIISDEDLKKMFPEKKKENVTYITNNYYGQESAEESPGVDPTDEVTTIVEPQKKHTGVWIAIAIGVIVLAVGGLLLMKRKVKK